MIGCEYVKMNVLYLLEQLIGINVNIINVNIINDSFQPEDILECVEVWLNDDDSYVAFNVLATITHQTSLFDIERMLDFQPSKNVIGKFLVPLTLETLRVMTVDENLSTLWGKMLTKHIAAAAEPFCTVLNKAAKVHNAAKYWRTFSNLKSLVLIAMQSDAYTVLKTLRSFLFQPVLIDPSMADAFVAMVAKLIKNDGDDAENFLKLLFGGIVNNGDPTKRCTSCTPKMCR